MFIPPGLPTAAFGTRGAAGGVAGHRTRFLDLGTPSLSAALSLVRDGWMALHAEGGSQLGLQLERPLQVAADELSLLARQPVLIEQLVQRAVEVAVSRVQHLNMSQQGCTGGRGLREESAAEC